MRLTLFFHLVLLFSNCESCSEECKAVRDLPAYHFEIPATLYPAKATFRVGDTITINSSFGDQVWERSACQRHPLID
ncbi:MAG: hypothetical protein AAFW73_25010 [Bacteroidota bacterium]